MPIGDFLKHVEAPNTSAPALIPPTERNRAADSRYRDALNRSLKREHPADSASDRAKQVTDQPPTADERRAVPAESRGRDERIDGPTPADRVDDTRQPSESSDRAAVEPTETSNARTPNEDAGPRGTGTPRQDIQDRSADELPALTIEEPIPEDLRQLLETLAAADGLDPSEIEVIDLSGQDVITPEGLSALLGQAVADTEAGRETNLPSGDDNQNADAAILELEAPGEEAAADTETEGDAQFDSAEIETGITDADLIANTDEQHNADEEIPDTDQQSLTAGTSAEPHDLVETASDPSPGESDETEDGESESVREQNAASHAAAQDQADGDAGDPESHNSPSEDPLGQSRKAAAQSPEQLPDDNKQQNPPGIEKSHASETARERTAATAAEIVAQVTANKGQQNQTDTTAPATSDASADAIDAARSRHAAREVATAKHAQESTRLDAKQLVDRVGNAIREAQANGGKLRIRLTPPELGTLQIEVESRGGEITARLEVQTASAQKALLDNIAQLKEAIAQVGGNVDNIEVELVETETDDQYTDPEQQSRQEGDLSEGDAELEEWSLNDTNIDPEEAGSESESAPANPSRSSATILDELDIQI